MDRRLFLLAPLSFALARTARAHSFRLRDIEIGHPWAKPSATGDGAVFLALSNHAPEADRLLGGTTPIAEQVVLRARDGAPLDGIELSPKRPVALRPGGKYIGLHGLKRPLAAGDTFPLTLRFARAGTIAIAVMVEPGPTGTG